mmetsp:Transcript_35349/g.80434  ORF Transcript_35349/g.80434 Transcript_35349/m.80434 type:complete len:302 (+) Transcript_35349:391-1296(+)
MGGALLIRQSHLACFRGERACAGAPDWIAGGAFGASPGAHRGGYNVDMRRRWLRARGIARPFGDHPQTSSSRSPPRRAGAGAVRRPPVQGPAQRGDPVGDAGTPPTRAEEPHRRGRVPDRAAQRSGVLPGGDVPCGVLRSAVCGGGVPCQVARQTVRGRRAAGDHRRVEHDPNGHGWEKRLRLPRWRHGRLRPINILLRHVARANRRDPPRRAALFHAAPVRTEHRLARHFSAVCDWLVAPVDSRGRSDPGGERGSHRLGHRGGVLVLRLLGTHGAACLRPLPRLSTRSAGARAPQLALLV